MRFEAPFHNQLEGMHLTLVQYRQAAGCQVDIHTISRARV